jgi:HK97 family phage portal protein
MGLAQLFHRSTEYVATDTATGASQTFTIVDNIAPDWSYGEYQGGMGIPGAWRAALLRADLVGSFPWHAYRSRGGKPAEQLDPNPQLLEQPCPYEPRVNTMTAWELDLIWHGNALGIISSRNRGGWPTAVLPVPAELVMVKRVGAADNTDLPTGAIGYQIGNRWFGAHDIFHVKGPHKPGALRGMGVLENHLNKTLSLADEQGRQARSLSTSGIPTGVLKSTDEGLEQDDADELKAAWLASQRDRTIAVLNATTDFQALSWDPTKTQLLEARKFSLHEIALIFGLDPTWLGVSADSMTYSNIESQATNLVKFSMVGDIARFEQTLSMHLPQGTEVKANLDSLLRSDTLTRYQAHQIGITSGFLTHDEVRSLENRPPLTSDQRALMSKPEPAPQPDQNPEDDK